MLTEKELAQFKVAKEFILLLLEENDGVISISTNVLPSASYPCLFEVNMTATAFFSSFGEREYEYRHLADGEILARYIDGGIDFHSIIPKHIFLNKCGGIR